MGELRCPHELQALLPLSFQVLAEGWVRQAHMVRNDPLIGPRHDFIHI